MAVAAFAALAAPAAGAGERQSGSFTFTSKVPGTPTGTVFSFDFVNPDDPNAKPYGLATMVIHYPTGYTVDTTVPPQCHATDAELLLEGPSACQAASKLGGGEALSDIGGSDPNSRYTKATISDFNNQDEIIGVGESQSSPTIRSVDHTRYGDGTSTTTFPVFPGFPPPDPFLGLKSLDITFPPYVLADGRTYARTPPACPRERFWTITLDFTYHDGVTQSVASHSPCRR